MISIVIPTYNEENCLERLLKYLVENSSGKNKLEIIIADGGSTDGTKNKIDNFKQVKFINSKCGRACQMNAGAAAANGEILYFLHADSFPPPKFDEHIIKAFVNCKFAGCFQMKFDSSHWWLQLMGWFTKLNHKACRGGDQSLFVSHKLFKQIGGFDESFVIYEDNDFIQKLYKQKQFTVIKEWLTTSARKYDQVGVWKLQGVYLMIYYQKWRGADAQQLISYYKKRVNY